MNVLPVVLIRAAIFVAFGCFEANGLSNRLIYVGFGRGKIFKTYSKAHAAGYIVNGIEQYQARFDNGEEYEKDPPVCFTNNPGRLDNGTAVRALGYFVCPYSNTDSLSTTYCCGDLLHQYCCGFWDAPSRMAGTLIGILLPVVIIILALIIKRKYICCSEPKYPPRSSSDDHSEEMRPVRASSNRKPSNHADHEPYSREGYPLHQRGGYDDYYLDPSENQRPQQLGNLHDDLLYRQRAPRRNYYHDYYAETPPALQPESLPDDHEYYSDDQQERRHEHHRGHHRHAHQVENLSESHNHRQTYQPNHHQQSLPYDPELDESCLPRYQSYDQLHYPEHQQQHERQPYPSAPPPDYYELQPDYQYIANPRI